MTRQCTSLCWLRSECKLKGNGDWASCWADMKRSDWHHSDLLLNGSRRRVWWYTLNILSFVRGKSAKKFNIALSCRNDETFTVTFSVRLILRSQWPFQCNSSFFFFFFRGRWQPLLFTWTKTRKRRVTAALVNAQKNRSMQPWHNLN